MNKLDKILVFGATSEIVVSMLNELNLTGSEIYLVARDLDKLNNLSLETNNCVIHKIAFDFINCNTSLLESKFKDISFDLVIFAQGYASIGACSDLADKDIDEMFAVNLVSIIKLSKSIVGSLKEGSQIIYFSSIAGHQGFGNWSVYCATKFGLEGFVKSIRQELRAKGIRVISAGIGAVDTKLWNSIEGEWDRSKMMTIKNVGLFLSNLVSSPKEISIEDIVFGPLGGNL